jgi:hypothetical protein
LLKFDNQHSSYVGHKTLFSANIIVMWKISNQDFFFPQICDIKKNRQYFPKKLQIYAQKKNLIRKIPNFLV